MSFAQRLVPLAIACAVVALGGCSMAPYRIGASDAAVAAAAAESDTYLPRLRPRALGVCYSPAFHEAAEVEAEAVYLCDGGRLVKQDDDVFWNGCSLSQPNRASYICYPPDKAKRPAASGS